MFFIYSILMFVIFSILSFVGMNITGNKDVFLPLIITPLFLSLAFTLVGFFSNMAQWGCQIERFEQIRKYKKLLKLKRKLFDELKVEWIKYLSVEYPNFEKGIFENMAPQEKSDLQMYFVKYPELSSSILFSKLIDNISSMTKSIYEIEENIEREACYIRNQLQNKWCLVQPSIPEDIKEEI
jgi:hypothetical protein